MQAESLDALLEPYRVCPPAQLSVVKGGRTLSLDRLRGLAIACMVLDHLCLIFHTCYWLRLTAGRVAMPLFFLVSGHLVRRLGWRHGWVLLLGLLVPFVVPWIDSPNVLVWYVVGAVWIVAARYAGIWLWLPSLVGLAWAANFGVWSPLHVGPDSFDGLMLIGIMGMGAALETDAFDWGLRLPRFFERIGRYPLSVYVGHLLILNGLVFMGWTAIKVVHGA